VQQEDMELEEIDDDVRINRIDSLSYNRNLMGWWI